MNKFSAMANMEPLVAHQRVCTSCLESFIVLFRSKREKVSLTGIARLHFSFEMGVFYFPATLR